MRSRALVVRVVVVLALGMAVLSPAFAEDVEKKWRLGLSIGGWNSGDEVASDAANVLILVDDDFLVDNRFDDPRDDSAVFGELSIQSGPLAVFNAQYAVTKTFIIEGSVGYGKHDVGDVEMQGQFFGVEIPVTQPFNFATYRIPVGELERIPLQLTGLIRFRPRASFNPYIGAGIGYSFIGFETSSELDELSLNMDRSIGGPARVTSSFNNSPNIVSPTDVNFLEGATIESSDTFEWHLAGGAELSFRRKWVAFLDLRLTFASRDFSVGFNGGDYLGVPVPNLTDFVDSPAGSMNYGPTQITSGGLIDGGSFEPEEDAPVNTDCSVSTTDCVFIEGEFDGVTDPGFYYAQGGSIDFDGISLSIGVRYTF